MPIVSSTQPGLNATLWGINPCFDKLVEILSARNVSVELLQTNRAQSYVSVGTPSIVVFWGEQAKRKIEEVNIRDLRISYEPNESLLSRRKNPTPAETFVRVSQVSNFAASYLRAHGYIVNVSIVNPEDLIDLDLDSGLRFDQIDPDELDPEMLRKELGLDY